MTTEMRQLCADIEYMTGLLSDTALWNALTSPLSSPRSASPRGVSPRSHSNSGGSNSDSNSVPLREHSGSGGSGGGATNAAANASTSSGVPAYVRRGWRQSMIDFARACAQCRAVARAASQGQERRKSIKDLDKHQQTLLHSTCFDGVYEDVEHLLRLNEIDINAKDRAGWTCLMSAACNGHWRICKLLMKNGADATIASFNGSSALHYLAKHTPRDKERGGYSKLFGLLLKKGASVAANSVGDTPLHAACSKANGVAAQLLLANWTRSVNIRNRADWTPLHFCAREGALDVAEMLVKRGADVDAKCVNADRGAVVLPIDVARQSGRDAFVQMLEARRRDKPKLFRALLRADHRTALSLVRDHPYIAATTYHVPKDNGAAAAAAAAAAADDDGATDWEGRRVAHFFAVRGDLASMRTLLAERAAPVDLNVLDHSGRSVLHLACRFADTKMVALLLEYGASASTLTAHGDTCFHLLAMRGATKDKSSSAVYRQLSSGGCDPARISQRGDAALHLAALNGCESLVRYLVTQPTVDVTLLDASGRTALQCSTLSSSSAIEQILSKLQH